MCELADLISSNCRSANFLVLNNSRSASWSGVSVELAEFQSCQFLGETLQLMNESTILKRQKYNMYHCIMYSLHLLITNVH